MHSILQGTVSIEESMEVVGNAGEKQTTLTLTQSL